MKEENKLSYWIEDNVHFSHIEVKLLSFEQVSIKSSPLCVPFDTTGDMDIDIKKWSKWVEDRSKKYIFGIPYNERMVLRVEPGDNPKVKYFEHTNILEGIEENMPLDSCPGAEEYIRYSKFKETGKEPFDKQHCKWFGGALLKNTTSIFSPPLKRAYVLEIVAGDVDESKGDTDTVVINQYKIPKFVNSLDYLKPPRVVDIRIDMTRGEFIKKSLAFEMFVEAFDRIDFKRFNFDHLIKNLAAYRALNDSQLKVATIKSILTPFQTPSSLYKEVKHYFLPEETGYYSNIGWYKDRKCLIACPWDLESDRFYIMFIEKKRITENKEGEDEDETDLETVISMYRIDDLTSDNSMKGPGNTKLPITQLRAESKLRTNWFYDITYSEKNKSMYLIPFDSNQIIQISYIKKEDKTYFFKYDFPMDVDVINGLGLKFSRGVWSSLDKCIYCIPLHFGGMIRIKVMSEDPLVPPQIELYKAKDWRLKNDEVICPEYEAECNKQ